MGPKGANVKILPAERAVAEPGLTPTALRLIAECPGQEAVRRVPDQKFTSSPSVQVKRQEVT
jgi:hypothetical protein